MSGVVGIPSRLSGVVGRPSQMSASSREAFPDVRLWSGGLTGGRKAHLHVRECSEGTHWWSGGPSRCPGVVGRPTRLSKSGRKALADVWEWSGGSPGCLGVVRRPTRNSGSG